MSGKKDEMRSKIDERKQHHWTENCWSKIDGNNLIYARFVTILYTFSGEMRATLTDRKIHCLM